MRTARRLAHGAVLAFTAFWLVATSKAPTVVKECFAPLRSSSLEITLGAPLPRSPEQGPSCAGLDGLVEGSTVRAQLGRRATPPKVSGGESTCWSYAAHQLRGPQGLTEVEAVTPSRTYPAAVFFESRAKFDSPSAACSGDYHLLVMPEAAFRDGMRADPSRAGTGGEAWRMRRVITMKTGSSCTAIPASRDGRCEDTFAVKAIADAR